MIQISRSGGITTAAEQLGTLRDEFAAKHCVTLPQLFSSDLLRIILRQLESAQFYRNSHKSHSGQEFAWDLTVRENELVLHLIHFVLNNPRVINVIQQITECPQIGSFAGRIYRSLPQVEHRLDWHDDTDRNERLLGLSINLSTERYDGGIFQLREEESGQILSEVGSGDLGDAHIFLISPQLQHRVTSVAGDTPRTSAAGWFLSEPDCLTALKNLSCSDTGPENRAS